MIKVLYNPLAGNKTGSKAIDEITALHKEDEVVYEDMTKITDYKTFLSTLAPEDKLCVAGGDGTLNRFVNFVDGLEIKNDVYFYPVGSGNDFMRDVAPETKDLVLINDYIKDLPYVEVEEIDFKPVSGHKYRFINGVGYGVDGYCCEKGNEEQAKNPDKKVNYTAIAIKGLLFHFKPSNAKITVDGVTEEYKKVWIAPAMNGKYYGGGMKVAPDQDRLHNETLTTAFWHGAGPLGTLMVFPKIFTGEHVGNKMVTIKTGKKITVSFSRPTPLQIDGEVVSHVTKYTAYTVK